MEDSNSKNVKTYFEIVICFLKKKRRRRRRGGNGNGKDDQRNGKMLQHEMS
jgi:hypothetical protein